MIKKENNKPKEYLTKETSSYIKVCALILILCHHFWGFYDWVLPQNSKYMYYIFGCDIENEIGAFGKICVSMFAFVTGYAIWINREKYKSIKYTLKKISILLVTYWATLPILYIVGTIYKEPMPDIKQFIGNLFGFCNAIYKAKGIASYFAWYISFYIMTLMIMMIYCKIDIKYNAKTDDVRRFLMKTAIMLIIVRVALYLQVHTLPIIEFVDLWIWLPVVFIGYFMAQCRIFERFESRLSNLSWVRIASGILVLVLVFTLRRYNAVLYGFNFDCLYAPLVIWALVTIGRIVKNKFNSTILKNVVDVIANESTNIWFLHCIFFTPKRSVQYIAYAPHYGILIIIWVLIMLIPVSMALRKITNPIIKKINAM